MTSKSTDSLLRRYLILSIKREGLELLLEYVIESGEVQAELVSARLLLSSLTLLSLSILSGCGCG